MDGTDKRTIMSIHSSQFTVKKIKGQKIVEVDPWRELRVAWVELYDSEKCRIGIKKRDGYIYIPSLFGY